MSSEVFSQAYPAFTHDEYARSRESASPRTVDSLLHKHLASGRVARHERPRAVLRFAGRTGGTTSLTRGAPWSTVLVTPVVSLTTRFASS